MQSLDGHVAVVTGGAKGIGLGIAKVLRGEGADVVLADVDGATAESAAAALPGGDEHAIAVTTDVSVRSSVEHMVAQTLERWGRLDILAANAGVCRAVPLRDLTGEDWDRIMAVNARGALYAIQACLAEMSKRRYGRIVLTSSITGPLVGLPSYGHYGATKAAMLGLMRSAALEVVHEGITINAVLPGNIRSALYETQSREHREAMLAHIPMGVLGEPEDIGWAVRYLASPEARYVTGQTLIVDGGQVLPE
jgi:3-oxoacyl-[acyl-carrier protein] reductase